jgi:hypothetical protein
MQNNGFHYDMSTRIWHTFIITHGVFSLICGNLDEKEDIKVEGGYLGRNNKGLI